MVIYRDRCEGEELCGWSAYEFGRIVELLELYCDDIGAQIAVVQKATGVRVHPIAKILSVKGRSCILFYPFRRSPQSYTQFLRLADPIPPPETWKPPIRSTSI